MSTPDYQATETARDNIGRAEDALNGASSAARDAPGTGRVNTTAAHTRTPATYARTATKSLLIVGVFAIGTLVVIDLLRRG